jgi:predicted nuclease of predicted toxin-antitoxin system
MNFVADEGIDAQIVMQLRQEGHSVWYVAEMSPGMPDTAVLDLANQENAILLTFDKDFGDLVYRQRHVSQGVILLRLHGLLPEKKAQLIVSMIHKHGPDLPGAFTVLTPEKVRVRPQLH